MNGNTTKIIAIGIVIVVAAAGVGIFMLMKNDKSGGEKVDAALEVFGNADKDYKIDGNDKDIIQNIIDNKDGYNLEKYPLADANHDGNVDTADIELVQKIINGESCTVYHMWYITNTDESRHDSKVVDTKWPIKKCIANGAANALLCYSMIGLDDKIVAINYSSTSPPDAVLYPKYHAMESLGTSTTYLTASKVTEAKTANPDITAVITADNKSYLSSTASGRIDEAGLEEMGLDVIRVKHAAVDPKEFSSALLLLGFLFQKESQAYEAAAWIENVYKELDDKLDGVTKLRVAATSGSDYLSSRNSDYADVTVQAGGEYTMPVRSSTSIKMAENAWMFEDQYQPDRIVMIRTGGSSGTWYSPGGLNLATFKTAMNDNFSEFKAFTNKQIYLTSGDDPVVARVLYSAAILYPDRVSMEYANEVHQEFVDKFLGGSYKVSELKFVYTFDEINAAS